MKRILTLATCLAVLCAGFVANDAHAATLEQRSYVGVQCIPMNGPFGFTLGTITNPSTSGVLGIQCPVSVPAAARTVTANYTALDSTASDDVRCTLWSVAWTTFASPDVLTGVTTGSPHFGGTFRNGNTSGSSPGVRVVNIPAISTSMGTNVFVGCGIPASTGIQNRMDNYNVLFTN